MDVKEFLDFYKSELVDKEISIFTLKGGEYSGEINRFANFEKLANELDLHPLKIAWIYSKKHLDSILSFINNGKVKSNEDIIGRINDVRNYMALIAGMIIKYRSLSKDDKWFLEKFNNVVL